MFRPGAFLVAATALFRLAAGQKITLQAEDALLSGTTKGSSIAGFTGSGYVEGFSETTDKITFTITSEKGGLHDVDLTYSGPNGDKKTTVVFNHASSNQVDLPATKSWKTVSAGQVVLLAGSNTVEIQSNWGYYLIDAITLTPKGRRGPHKMTTTPVNAHANADAKALLKYLGSMYGKHILSGQQDQASLDWVRTNIGKTPAMLGVDLMEYTDSRTSRGGKSHDIDDAIAFAQKGGIITVVWHWGAPAELYDSASQPWSRGFYTSATGFNLASAMADPSSAHYKLLVRDMDTIAQQLQRLQAAHIPVLFRPLHEAEGTWFWWGAHGPLPCKALYRLLYTRLTHTHRLNNLVWIWNSLSPDWYPGNDVVDIVSADIYSKGNHGAQVASYNSLLQLTGDTKMVAAAEVGSLMLPGELRAYQADWLWFCVWSGEFVMGAEWNARDLIRRVYEDERVLTLDEIQGWRGVEGLV